MTFTFMDSSDKYSVIIPTLQKAWSITRILLDVILKDENVGEVILINNCGTPINLVNNKLKVVNLQENIFVNPAWNLGVELSMFENIALVNDDIILPNNIFGKIGNLEEYGIVGYGEYIPMDHKTYDVGLASIDLASERKYNFGVFMVFKKERYIPIPNEIKIWYGDDWLFYHNKNNGTLDIPIKVQDSTTSSLSEFDNQKKLDHARLQSTIINN